MIKYRLLPCQGSPCLWTVVPIRPGEDPSVKTSRENLTRGVVITYVEVAARILDCSSLMGSTSSQPESQPPAAFILTQDDLASFRLKARSDVVGTWEIASTTYKYFYCQVKIRVSAHCFTSTTSRSGKSHCSQQTEKVDSVATTHTRVLLLPPELTRLTQPAVMLLRRTPIPLLVPRKHIVSHSLGSTSSKHHCLLELEKAPTTWTFLLTSVHSR